jgi:hypothetical protein
LLYLKDSRTRARGCFVGAARGGFPEVRQIPVLLPESLPAEYPFGAEKRSLPISSFAYDCLRGTQGHRPFAALLLPVGRIGQRLAANSSQILSALIIYSIWVKPYNVNPDPPVFSVGSH